MTKPFFVFDLDDTLYLERDYSKSALYYLGHLVESELSVPNAANDLLAGFENGEPDAIGSYWQKHKLDSSIKEHFINRMRSHLPNIKLFPDSDIFLNNLRKRDVKFAIVTDGRSVTQRAKIAALGLLDAEVIAISEESGASKPAEKAFHPIIQMLQGYDKKVHFVGDNPSKDFYIPNLLGWDTYMRKDNGFHVHTQSLSDQKSYSPDFVIQSFRELSRCFSEY